MAKRLKPVGFMTPAEMNDLGPCAWQGRVAIEMLGPRGRQITSRLLRNASDMGLDLDWFLAEIDSAGYGIWSESGDGIGPTQDSSGWLSCPPAVFFSDPEADERVSYQPIGYGAATVRGDGVDAAHGYGASSHCGAGSGYDEDEWY